MVAGVLLLFGLLFLNNKSSLVFALERHIHAGAGGSSPQELPLFVAKDLGIFQKYGLDVDLVVIGGGSRLMQALIGRSLDSANVAAMAPIRANLSGANVVITGAFLNKNLYKFITRKEIRKPSDLRGKKLGVVNFGGANEFSILMALKAWNIPSDAVKIVPAGDSMSRLAALEVSGGLDGTVVPYSNAIIAAQKGLNILGDLAEIVKEFPDRTFIAERSFLETKRDNAKRLFQAVSEAVYRLRTQPQLREKIVAIIAKRLRIAPWKIQDYYGTKHKGPGMDHIGFKVEDLAAFKNDVEILSKADPEWLAPKSANLESEYNVVIGLLQTCRYGRHQLPDPEGNFIDVSE